MNNFFSSSAYMIISAIVSIIGLVGTGVGFYQFYLSNRELKRYKHLFDIADQNIDKADKEKEVAKLKQRIEAMQEAVEKHIPEQAKRISLEHLIEQERENLTDHYKKYQVLKSELNEYHNQQYSEDNELIKQIKREIEPKYTYTRFQNITMYLYLFVTLIGTLLLKNLPFLSPIILIVQFILIGRVLYINIKNNYSKVEIITMKYKGLRVLANICILFALIWIYAILMDGSDEFFILLISSFIVTEVFNFFAFRMVKEKKKIEIIMILAPVILVLVLMGLVPIIFDIDIQNNIWLAIFLLISISLILSFIYNIVEILKSR